MAKQNCWEFMNCGLEEGGARAAEKGLCPAAAFTPADGFLGGKNGGRACCYVAGNFTSGVISGTQKMLSKSCFSCEFYRLLKLEHGAEMFSYSFREYIQKRAAKAPSHSRRPPGSP